MNRKKISIFQNVGLLGILTVVFVSVVSGLYVDADNRMEILIVSLVMFLPAVFAAFGIRGVSLALVGTQTVVYAAYKLFMLSAYTEKIKLINYIWLFVPIVFVVSVNFYVESLIQLESYNEYLNIQAENYVMIDNVTGLYNRRSLLNDLSRDMSYSVRRGLDLTLMVIELKYADELKRILSPSQFDDLKREIADIIIDHLRMEDKVYSLDENGGMAIVLNIDIEGAKTVLNKIRTITKQKDAFNDILGRELYVELKMGMLQFKKEEHQNAVDFFHKTENELQYDV